jgi:hypothetical protein
VVDHKGIVAPDELEAARFLEGAVRRQAPAFLLAGEERQKGADVKQRTAA